MNFSSIFYFILTTLVTSDVIPPDSRTILGGNHGTITPSNNCIFLFIGFVIVFFSYLFYCGQNKN